MFIGDEANPFKADREDFRDEIERLEAEQATFLAAFEDDGKVVAGPELGFKTHLGMRLVSGYRMPLPGARN